MHRGSVLYGIDINGKIVWVNEIPYEMNGLKMNLRCPICGERLIARRYATKTGIRKIQCLAHCGNSSCPGIGESGQHKYAKAMLKGLVGETVYLPRRSLYDCVPHESRYTKKGQRRKVEHPLMPWSKRCKVRDVWVDTKRPCGVVTKVLIERECEPYAPDGVIPDAMVFLDMGDGEPIPLAIEIRRSGPKRIGDVEKYAAAGISCLEILIGDLRIDDEDYLEKLRARLSGIAPQGMSKEERKDLAFRSREWLYNRTAGDAALSALHLEVLGKYVKVPDGCASLGTWREKRIVAAPGAPREGNSLSDVDTVIAEVIRKDDERRAREERMERERLLALEKASEKALVSEGVEAEEPGAETDEKEPKGSLADALRSVANGARKFGKRVFDALVEVR